MTKIQRKFLEQNMSLKGKNQKINDKIKELESKKEELADEIIELMKSKKVLMLPQGNNIFNPDRRIILNAQTIFQDDLIVFNMENIAFVDNKAFAVGKKGDDEVLYALRKNGEKDYNLITIDVITGGRRLNDRFSKSVDFQFLSADKIITRTFRYNYNRVSSSGREFQEEYCMYILKDCYKMDSKRIELSSGDIDHIPFKTYDNWITIRELNLDEGRNLWRSTESYKKMTEEMENNKIANMQRKTEPALPKEEKQHNVALKRKMRGL